MEKLKTICRWVGVDGLLHFLVCYGMMLALTPIVGVWWSLFAAVLASLVKEAIDSIMNDSDECNAAHDLICDGAGVLAALITMAIWMV
jgi:uncharacterized membrane protein YjdF